MNSGCFLETVLVSRSCKAQTETLKQQTVSRDFCHCSQVILVINCIVITAAECHHPLVSTKLYWLMAEARVCVCVCVYIVMTLTCTMSDQNCNKTMKYVKSF